MKLQIVSRRKASGGEKEVLGLGEMANVASFSTEINFKNIKPAGRKHEENEETVIELEVSNR